MEKSGLYWHIPFCRALCSYCDFAKTANYDGSLTAAYLQRLGQATAAWTSLWTGHYGSSPRFSSLFLGGGTPSLFSHEYEPLFAALEPFLAADCEVTLEANPDDLTSENLLVWRDLGVTRLSVGVQTFSPDGLRLLGRAHDASGAVAGIRRAAAYIPRVSLDLIYGWPGQDLAVWDRDLTTALALPIGHLSAYTLTYEPRTPMGRRKERGVVAATSDDRVADMYDAAVSRLGDAGFEQDEVSNWSRPGETSRHNYLYWQDDPYVGVGAGAHGYLTQPDGIGCRYAYDRSERLWVRRELFQSAPETPDVAAAATQLGAVHDAGRDADAWILEYVGSALRCAAGVDLKRVTAKTGRVLAPTRVVADALDVGQLRLTGGDRLVLDKSEWFRETSWSVAVAAALGTK
jgi:oxygen-independent coproporphyrinogen-3 oxidase